MIDTKYDWYQNGTHVFISYKVSKADVQEKAEITFDAEHVMIKYEDISLTLELSNQIIPEESSKSVTAKKIELKLKKAVENTAWLKIEKAG